jgi:uncharacterized iron-regulated membrane protein
MIRGVFVLVHRWVGLLMAVFLVIVGLTGSLLAFNNELEHLFAPQLFAKPHPGVAPLDLATLAERAASLVPHARVAGVSLRESDQAQIGFRSEKDPATRRPYDLGFTQFYVDPWTGAELGHRTRADLSEGLINFMPVIYKLHDSLMLGMLGSTILGVVAVTWTIDCFVGVYLTLPISLSGFWRKWKSAWFVKRGAGFYRLNFDLHRASGLWFWPVLFVFAWSSVMFNMRSVYEWVTPKMFDYRYLGADTKELATRTPKPHPVLEWRAALAVGERLMGEQAAIYGLTSVEPRALSYNDQTGVYTYSARSSLNMTTTGGSVYVIFDGDSGALLKARAPNGQHTGNTITSWLVALHMARVFGLPYRVFVCALGLAVTLLSATGVYIWWKKRSARLARNTRLASDSSPLEPKAAE